MSTSAASHLPPSYPGRAPWGTTRALRAWQEAALESYLTRQPRDFLAVATPGAGKTTYALRIATELLARRVVEAVTVVTPTEHLKHQWAEAAARVGVALDPEFSNAAGAVAKDFVGVAVTYAQVAAHPLLHRRRTELRRTLVILDEVHHAGDALSWGEAVEEAFDPATRRLALTGTPFRSDANPIPFVTYAPGADGILRSASDHSYGYGDALRDGVVRPVMFMAYSGSMRWRTRAGDEIAATLGEPLTKDLTAQAWRTALDPAGEWMPAVLAAADQRLREVRRHVGDAGGLVVAGDHAHARAYARILESVSGERPAVVLSDEPGASERISEFGRSTQRWMVAVRMVSEGVDLPRLSVGVYATPLSTPLFFAQLVGRFVRARRRGETASVFLPSVPVLLALAAELEAERDHVLGPRDDQDWVPLRESAEVGVDELEFEALGSAATFDRVLFDGGEFGTGGAIGSPEEQDYLGLPGLLEPDQVAVVLRARQHEQVRARAARPAEPEPTASRTELRAELSGLVGAWHHRTGQSHATIHAELRRESGGPVIAQATGVQIQARIDLIRQWAIGHRRSSSITPAKPGA
jgi:superfamily II DNA or RNA helicase